MAQGQIVTRAHSSWPRPDDQLYGGGDAGCLARTRSRHS